MLKKLLRMLLPVNCQICYQLGDYLCHDCQGFFLEGYGETVATTSGLEVTVCYRYNKAIEHLWSLAKHHGYYEIAYFLGALMRGPPVMTAAQDSVCYVPVPVSRDKLRRRGFNQVDELIKGMGMKPCQLLIRTKDTRTQIGQNSSQRRKNLSGAFAINAKVCVDKSTEIILVDDIYTTGTTVSECANTLIVAGYRCNRAVVFAKG